MTSDASRIEEPEDENPAQQPATPEAPEGEPSPLWVLAFGGLALTLLGGLVIYETLAIFSDGLATYLECLRGGDTALTGCGEGLDLAFEYRYGLDGMRALGAALFAAFVGPIPMIVMLNRYRNHFVGGVVFFLVMFPYGLLSFLVILIGVFVIIFYGIELT